MTHKLLTKLKTSVSLVAGLAGAITIAATGFSNANAWGPERSTYTNKEPAPYATFNSITDNVAVGDERNFVRIREAGTDTTYTDEIQVVPGHEYEVYIYYHNNAASNINASGLGMATNTRVSSAYPTVVNTNERGMVSGIISWSYVTPENPNDAQTGTVWDEAYVTSATDGVVLKYKTGTAIIHNDGAANGSVLPTSLFTEGGTPIGYNKLTGSLPGCAEYSGHITYTLVAENPGSELTKQVSVDGENWFEGVTVSPGDFVTYRVAFENTGNTDFTNVILTDTHDAELILRPGSTKIYDYQHTDGYAIEDIIDISGFNTGNLLAGGLVQATYQMQVKNDPSVCGKTFTNTIFANYNSTEKKSDATTVKVVCDEPPTEEDCNTNPNLPGCATPPATTEDCNTNPNLPGCELPESIVQTGPLEIVMAILVIAGIGGAGFYLWRTKHTLKTVENVVTGNTPTEPTTPIEPITPTEPSTPIEPTAPTEPTNPTDSISPAEFSKPASNPAEPFTPTEPTSEPEQPVEPTEPAPEAQPEQPAEPTEPVEPQPEQPETPSEEA